jgi:RHS repeat-associated protein
VFNAVGRHQQTLEALTGAVRYTFDYDDAGRLERVTDASGNETTVERSGGQPTAIVAPRGQRTSLSLDANGFLASIGNDLAGETTTFDYTPGGLLTLMTDARGHDYVFDYDDDPEEANLGRLERADDPEGGFQTFARTGLESNYAVIRETAEGRTTSYAVATQAIGSKQRVNTFPSELETTTLTGTDGTRTSTFADTTRVDRLDTADPRFGMQAPVKSRSLLRPSKILSTLTQSRSAALEDELDPLSVISATTTFTLNGEEYTREFTAATRTVTDTTPMGRERMTILDAKGRVVSEQVGNLEPTTIVYGTLGRVETITRGSGGSARTYTLTYESTDPRQRLESIKDPLDRTVRFTYDDADRVRTQTLPDLQAIAYDYDANGNVTSITPPAPPGPPDPPAHGFEYTDVDLEENYAPPAVTGSGTTNTIFTYNLDRQLELITRPDTDVVDPGYNPTTGRLETLTSPTRTLTYVYDPITGHLTNVNVLGPDGPTLAYGYDGPLLTTTMWGGPVAGSVGRTYDENFLVTAVTATDANGAQTAMFLYDEDGLLSTATGPAPAGTMIFTRDPVIGFGAGLLTHTTLGALEDTRTYTSFGELATYTAGPVGGGTPYLEVTYDTPAAPRDKFGRIVTKTEAVRGDPSQTTVYGYDARGRLKTVTPESGPVVTYTYDANGNRGTRQLGGVIVESGSYDDQDRLLSYGNATYEYTANGELATKTVDEEDTTTYTYDALGNLLAVELPDGAVIGYVVDGQNRRIGKKVDGELVQGFLWEDQLRITAELDAGGNIVSRFVYGTRANVPEYMIRSGGVYRLVTDHLGSPRLVIDVASGEVVQEIEYDEFGRRTVIEGPDDFQPFGFAGGLYDQDTKLVRFGARDYDATTGRWTSKDPIGFAAGDTGFFVYAGNDPVNFQDPTGLYVSPSSGKNRNRNRFNLCPARPPTAEVEDQECKEPVPGGPDFPRGRLDAFPWPSWWFHGGPFGFQSFRFPTPIPGYPNATSQCVYDPQGALVDQPPFGGTFDYHDPGANLPAHVVDDVFPGFIDWGRPNRTTTVE